VVLGSILGIRNGLYINAMWTKEAPWWPVRSGLFFYLLYTLPCPIVLTGEALGPRGLFFPEK
jgi:hypothetical protein